MFVDTLQIVFGGLPVLRTLFNVICLTAIPSCSISYIIYIYIYITYILCASEIRGCVPANVGLACFRFRKSNAFSVERRQKQDILYHRPK